MTVAEIKPKTKHYTEHLMQIIYQSQFIVACSLRCSSNGIKPKLIFSILNYVEDTFV